MNIPFSKKKKKKNAFLNVTENLTSLSGSLEVFCFFSYKNYSIIIFCYVIVGYFLFYNEVWLSFIWIKKKKIRNCISKMGRNFQNVPNKTFDQNKPSWVV